MFYFEKDRQEIREWIAAAVAATEEKFNWQIESMRQEISALKKLNEELSQELENLKEQAAQDSDESIFYLEKPAGVYIPKNRAEIPAKLKRAAAVDEINKFLAAQDTDTSKKFQRLLDVHLKLVNGFLEKLNVANFDEEELSEAVTTKFFRLFQRIFFDNIIVAISRGVREGNIFYFEFLDKVNEYLSSCGIYTVNEKAGAPVTDENYRNMTPQIRKTEDKNLAGIVAEIERLPYRINYLNEFGEEKFLQYNGVMTIYKVE